MKKFSKIPGDNRGERQGALPDRDVAVKVSLLYLLAGVLWILITNRFVMSDQVDVEIRNLMEVGKGLLFVFLSASLIYVLIATFNRHVQRQAQELKAVFSTPELGALRFDHDGRIESFTTCLPELTGYPGGELRVKTLRELVHPEDWETEAELLEKFRRGEIDRASHTLRLVKRDGSTIWVEQNIRLFEDAEKPSFVSTVQWVSERIEAEKKLAERARRLQTAQEIAKLGDWTYDPTTEELTWSEEMYRIMERDPEEGPLPVEQMLEETLAKPDAERLRNGIERAYREGVPYDLELTFKVDAGVEKQLRCLGVPHPEKEGKWTLRGIVQDTSERTNLMRSLTAHQEQLRVVVNNLPGVIFQYRLTPEGDQILTYLSEGTENLWGFTKEEIFADIRIIWQQSSEPEQARLWESIRKSAATLQPWNCIWEYHHPELGLRWLEGYGLPRRARDGSTIWNSIVIDVTSRVELESRVTEHEEYWQLLSRHASDGIVACDEGGSLVFLNDTVRSWVGELDASAGPADWARTSGLYNLDGNRLLREDEVDLARALKGEKVRNYRYMIKKERRNVRYVESNGGPLYDRDGRQIGAMVIIRDISERFRREFEITNAVLEAAEKEQLRIAGELHDSVTQELSIVSLNLNNFLLENAQAGESERLAHARRHLDQAIERVRGISHGIMPGTVMDLGLIGAVNELLEDFQNCDGMDVSLIYNRERRMNENLELDLFRIVQEALNNVRKHAKASTATVRMTFHADHFELVVEDDGIGFDASKAGRKGTGIGLRTMRNRALRWGGSFFINSDNIRTSVHAHVPLKDPT